MQQQSGNGLQTHIRNFVDATLSLYTLNGGRAGHVARALGDERIAPHMHRETIVSQFGAKGFPEMEQLLQIVDGGVPVDVAGTRDRIDALQYGNKSCAVRHESVIAVLILKKVHLGRLLLVHRDMAHMIPNVPASPLALVSSSSK